MEHGSANVKTSSNSFCYSSKDTHPDNNRPKCHSNTHNELDAWHDAAPRVAATPVDVDDAEDPDPEPEPEEPEGPELMRDAVAEYPIGAVADEVCWAATELAETALCAQNRRQP